MRWRDFVAAADAWLSDLGPNRDAHNERIKLFATSLNAVGLASLIGGLLGPLVDPSRHGNVVTVTAGTSLWLVFSFAAYQLLRYIRAKD